MGVGGGRISPSPFWVGEQLLGWNCCAHFKTAFLCHLPQTSPPAVLGSSWRCHFALIEKYWKLPVQNQKEALETKCHAFLGLG